MVVRQFAHSLLPVFITGKCVDNVPGFKRLFEKIGIPCIILTQNDGGGSLRHVTHVSFHGQFP